MKLNNHTTIVDLDKFLESHKATANYYWNKKRSIAKPYYNRVKEYEKKNK